MSNAYRAIAQSKAEIEAERKDAYQRRLAQAREVLADFDDDEPGAKFARACLEARGKSLGIPELERDIRSLDLLIKSGDQSREMEHILNEKNLERLKKGEELVAFRVPVSAACHLAAIRERDRKQEQMRAAQEQTTIDAAEYVMQTYRKIAAEAKAAPTAGTQASAKPAPEQAGDKPVTPAVTATSKVG